ncbi:cyclin-domain-containing protein [Podospora australis]|uniref:Cyclin-domain-containing protein n=1 Tax=Podospora australis TaxID=1536484 RepID=A0AAN6WL84_9PEZI|nr:cyclin-domain-containing protein [Podospora australis]
MTDHEDHGPREAGSSDSSAVPSPPPPPNPSADPKLRPVLGPEGDVSPTLVAQVDDIFEIAPKAALKMLSLGIEALVNMTGDVPPTPPPRSPTIPHMRGMEAEKKSIVRSNSEKNLAKLLQQRSASNSPRPSPRPARSPLQNASIPNPDGEPQAAQAIDGVQLKPQHTAPSSSRAIQQRSPLAPYIVVGENSQPLNLQHSAITRKFYSRLPPPISITDYLLRIHQFCPMSTAVYLATSLYIHRLAVLERAIVVTKRNAHRLLLAGLRVAMKALEDLSYPHGKVAKVGGVSEAELARLEISFCFLTGFELMVKREVLSRHWEMLRRGTDCWSVHDHEEHEAGGVGDNVVVLDFAPGRRDNTVQAGA